MSTVQSQIERKFEIHVKEHPGELLQHINSAWKERRLCDFFIKVGSKEIPVHKIVLSEGSDYFKAMFSHKMQEAESGVAVMEGVDPECMLICIEYIYTGKVSVPESKVQPLLQVASMLQLTRFCEVIGSFLESNLDPDSFFLTRKIANTFNLQGLKDHCDKYALENFKSIAVKEGFKDLKKEYVQFLVKSEETNATEAMKSKALIIWASKDVEKRSEIFEQMFQLLELTRMPTEYLKHLEEKEALVYESNTCLRRLFRTLIEAKDTPAKDVSLLECGSVGDYHNAIIVFDDKAENIQAFYPQHNSWKTILTISAEIANNLCSAALLEDNIYVLTGGNASYKLELTTKKWTRLPDRNSTSNALAIIASGRVYAFEDAIGSSKVVEKLNSFESTWRHVTEKPVPGYQASVVAGDDFIYCIGGYDGSKRLDSFHRFYPRGATWTDLPSLPTPRNGIGAAKLGEKIYAIGGLNVLVKYISTVECFDLNTEEWTTLSSMINPKSYFNACVVRGKIYAVGGYAASQKIEEFDPTQNSWKVVQTISDKQPIKKASFPIYFPH